MRGTGLCVPFHNNALILGDTQKVRLLGVLAQAGMAGATSAAIPAHTPGRRFANLGCSPCLTVADHRAGNAGAVLILAHASVRLRQVCMSRERNHLVPEEVEGDPQEKPYDQGNWEQPQHAARGGSFESLAFASKSQCGRSAMEPFSARVVHGVWRLDWQA